jgi:16S rRNA (adenine(1408)-N(1))-methyltransferase
VDVGTGDGAYVLSTARACGDVLVIGMDANAEGMRRASFRAGRRAARGGLPNALFVRLAIDEAPAELHRLADAVTVLLPWGSLLVGVAQPQAEALERLRALCRPGARMRVILGYGQDDARALGANLRSLDEPSAAAALVAAYRAAGFAVQARSVSLPEIRALSTTWAKRLAFSSRDRRFVEVSGVAVPGEDTP